MGKIKGTLIDSPFPGSDEALKLGCACPVLSNEHGKGCLGDGKRYGWVMNANCSLHGISDISDTISQNRMNYECNER